MSRWNVGHWGSGRYHCHGLLRQTTDEAELINVELYPKGLCGAAFLKLSTPVSPSTAQNQFTKPATANRRRGAERSGRSVGNFPSFNIRRWHPMTAIKSRFCHSRMIIGPTTAQPKHMPGASQMYGPDTWIASWRETLRILLARLRSTSNGGRPDMSSTIEVRADRSRLREQVRNPRRRN